MNSNDVKRAAIIASAGVAVFGGLELLDRLEERFKLPVGLILLGCFVGWVVYQSIRRRGQRQDPLQAKYGPIVVFGFAVALVARVLVEHVAKSERAARAVFMVVWLAWFIVVDFLRWRDAKKKSP